MTPEEKRSKLYTELFLGTISERRATKIHKQIHKIECKLMRKEGPVGLQMSRGQCFQTLGHLGYCSRDQIEIFHGNLAIMTGSERLNFLTLMETKKVIPLLPTQNGCNRCDLCDKQSN